nr:pentatricopeptide repeat-containing protein At3g09040, mitochondrial-like [Coffea arabica]XP_027121656.1 pentatricopeptide repeat-containing protein At3g09040, mitochondrial-like [Coffea arabica]
MHNFLRSLQSTRLLELSSIAIIRSKILSSNHRYCSITINGPVGSKDDEDAYVSILRKCIDASNLRNAKAIHAKIFKGDICGSSWLFLGNHLINAFAKCGETCDALQLFDEMPQKNVVSWTALIAGFEQKGLSAESFSLFKQMGASGMRANEFTLVSALHACSAADFLGVVHVYQVYGLIIRLGFESNVHLLNAFLVALMRHRRLSEAFEVFEESHHRDIVSWNTIIGGYLQLSCREIPGFWVRMISEGIVPDGFTFASVLTGLAELLDFEMGVQVHGKLVKSGHGSEMCVGNALVDMYLKNRKLVEGFKAFEEIPLLDVSSWTQMAIGCLNCGEPNVALKVIGEMRRKGVKPNKFTLATAFNVCANLTSLEEGEKIHGLRIKLGHDVDVCVENALLDMYAKCGCMSSALKVFRSMDEWSVVSWTTMVMGFAQNGCAKEALEIFDEMRLKRVEPNCITFICALYACSQGGFVNEGWSYFSSMSSQYGIDPGEDHYACMVSLLGRSGCIKEAEELIHGMPFKPSLLIWQTLLGACRLHGDNETAKRAAEHALHLDKTDPSAYVLLSNTFASSNNWDSVGILREVMESQDVKKMPGSSWIELDRNESVTKSHRVSI